MEGNCKGSCGDIAAIQISNGRGYETTKKEETLAKSIGELILHIHASKALF